jgi:hypothetical protein
VPAQVSAGVPAEPPVAINPKLVLEPGAIDPL